MNINYRFRSGLPQFSDTFETRTNNLCDEFFEAKENTTSRQILLRFDEELPFIYNESPCQLAERLYLGLQIARLKSDEGDIISACFDCNKALSLYSFFNCDFPELEADLLTEQCLCLDSI